MSPVVRLRPAEPQDSFIFWEVRHEYQPMLTWDEHKEWFDNTWEHRYVLHHGPATVGVVRITPHGNGSGTLHILICQNERQKGLGTAALQSIKRVARDDLGLLRLQAEVHEKNSSSRGAFISAGWAPTRFEVTL